MKNIKISNFTKIRPVTAELFHAGGQTDMTKLTVAFRSFANASKRGVYVTFVCKQKALITTHMLYGVAHKSLDTH